MQAALDRLQTALTTDASSGALRATDATDASHRLSDLRQAIDQRNTDDAVHRIADFDRRLTELERQGHLTTDAATQLRAALADLRGTLGASTSTQKSTGSHGGDNGDDGNNGDGGD